MFSRRVVRKPVGIGVIATGSGGLSIASKLGIEDLFVYLLHSSQDQVFQASDNARKWSNAVVEYVLGCEWNEKKGWVPLVEGAGRGAGKVVEYGRGFWNASREKILEDIVSAIAGYEKTFGTSINLLLFIDTLGGGTGSAIWDLPIYLEDRLRRGFNAGEIANVPMTCGIYTYPGSFEALKYRRNAWNALVNVGSHNSVKSALIVDIDRFYDRGNANEAYIFEKIATKISRMVRNFIELFGNPSAVIEGADVYDVTRPMTPPFGIMSEFGLEGFSTEEIRKNATALPYRGRGEKAFVGIMRNIPVSLKQIIVNAVEKELKASPITHIVDLNRDSGIIIYGSYRLRDIIPDPNI
jgi:hypothetical protein